MKINGTKKVNLSIIASLIIFIFVINISEIKSAKPVLAQSTIIVITTTPTVSIPSTDLVNDNGNDVEVLKGQLEVMETYSDRISNVYIGTGAIIITLISVFLGINLFVNNRQYKNDIEKITKQLQQSLDHKIETGFSNIQSQIDSRIDMKFNKVQRTIIDLQIDQLKMEAKEWADKKVIANEIRAYTKIIELYPTSLSINFTLDKLLNALLKEDVFLSSNDIEGIMSALEKVDKNFQPVIDTIIESAKLKIDVKLA